jgi:hypothetical protein
VLYNFQSVYIKQPFYIAFVKYFVAVKFANMGRKSLPSDTDTIVANFGPIRAGVIC